MLNELLNSPLLQDPHLQALLRYLEAGRTAMTWIDVLDIAFIGALLSICLVWTQKKTARSVLVVLFPMLMAYGAANVLKMRLTSALFQFGLVALAISVVVIFQEDFRRALEAIASFGNWRKARDLPQRLPEILTESLVGFSENKVGGLVVLQGRESVERFVRGGILLQGLASVPLLQSIFDNHSPGHDGGALFVNGILERFAVHLPLSRNGQGTGRLGTRHAAALGLSEKCDALILVVSEETGTMSAAKNGRLHTVKSKTALSDAIREHLKALAPAPVYKGVFRIPWLRLTTSFSMAFALWLLLVRPIPPVIEREKTSRMPDSQPTEVPHPPAAKNPRR